MFEAMIADLRGTIRLGQTLRALHVSAHAVALLARALRDQRRRTRPKL